MTGRINGYLENWRVINSFTDSRSFREYFLAIFSADANWLWLSRISGRAQSLFERPEINEPAPVYAAFNREEHKSDALRDMYYTCIRVYRRRRARMRPRSVPRTCVRAYNSGNRGGWDTRANPWPVQGYRGRWYRRRCPLMREKIVKSRYIGFFYALPRFTFTCSVFSIVLSLLFFRVLSITTANQSLWSRPTSSRACGYFKRAYMHFSPVLRRRRRNILSDGIYAFLWNMFKIFKTCLAEGITATKEYGTRAQSLRVSLLFVRPPRRLGDWN